MVDDPIAGKNPYVGPKPFEIGQPLFGRDREVLELRYLLTSERIVLLYSPSGAGKSSLVNAGLIPKLQQRFEIWGPTRVNSQPPDDALNRYTWSAISGLARTPGVSQGIPDFQPPDITWTTHLSRTPWKKNPLIIFDQFEEILRVDPIDTPVKRAFFEDLGDALSNPQIWALFILREDYLAPLDPFARLIPTHFQNRYRLDRLTRAAAVEAIEKPTTDTLRKYAPTVADTLAQNLATVSVQHLDGTRTDEIGDYVEPLQLQVVCYDLWDRMRADDLSIDPEDVGDVGNALSNYYSKKVAEVAGGAEIIERRIRDWFNDQLITRDGVRNQVRQEPGQSGGLQNEFVSELVDTYIVRQEPRGGSTWYELAHDRLVPPIRQNNEEWFAAHLHKVQQRAVQWQKEEEPASLLLVDKDLEEAEQWASDNTLQYSEERFLQACRAQQAQLDDKRRHEAEQRKYQEEQIRQAEEKRKEALRFRKLAHFATAVGILAILGMIGAIVAFIQARRATDEATKQAKIARDAEGEAKDNFTKAQAATKEATRLGNLADGERAKLKVSLGETNLALARVAVEQAEQRADTRPGAALAFLDSALTYDPSSVNARTWITSLLVNANWYPDAVIPEFGEFSPDGLRILTQPAPNVLQLWDPQTHQRIGKPMDAGGPPTRVAFNPTSQIILTVTGKVQFDPTRQINLVEPDKLVRLWNAETQNPIAELPVAGSVAASVFNPTGKYLATASGDTIQVWDTSNGAPFGRPIKAFAPTSMLLSHDGRRLYLDRIAIVDDGASAIADVQSGVLVKKQPVALPAVFSPTGLLLDTVGSILTKSDDQGGSSFTKTTIAGVFGPVSPDGRSAVKYDGDSVRVFDIATGTDLPAPATYFTGERPFADFTPDGNHLRVYMEDGTIAFLDLAAQTVRKTKLPWEDALPFAARLRAGLPSNSTGGLPNAAGTFLLANSPAATYLSKATHEGWAVRTYPRNGAVEVSYDTEGRILLLSANDLRVRDPETGAELRRLEGFRALSDTGRYAVTESPDHFLQVREVSSGAAVGKRLGPLTGLRLTALSRDARRLVTGSQTSEVYFWDVQSGERKTIPFDTAVTSLAFSPNGKYFLTTNGNGLVRQWDGDTGARSPREYGNPSFDPPAISPEGSHFFTANGNYINRNNRPPRSGMSVWNAISGPAVPMNDFQIVYAFSPNGERILALGNDGVQIRDLATSKPIGRAMNIAGIVQAAFGPRGYRLVTMTDQAIQIWDAETGEPIGLAAPVTKPLAFALSPDAHQLAILEGDIVKLTPVFLGSDAETDQLRSWAQAIGGFRITQSGSIDPIPFPDRFKLIQQLRQSAASAPPGGSSLASHLRRFFALK